MFFCENALLRFVPTTVLPSCNRASYWSKPPRPLSPGLPGLWLLSFLVSYVVAVVFAALEVVNGNVANGQVVAERLLTGLSDRLLRSRHLLEDDAFHFLSDCLRASGHFAVCFTRNGFGLGLGSGRKPFVFF